MYTYETYQKILDEIESKSNLVRITIAENIVEFGLDEEIPILRLLYNYNTKDVVLTFHVQTNCTDAIQIHSQLSQVYPKIKLAVDYYVDATGKLITGADAQFALYKDIQNDTIDTVHPLEYKNDEYDDEELDSEAVNDFITRNSPKKGGYWN